MEQDDQPRKRARMHDPSNPITDVEQKFQQNGDAVMADSNGHNAARENGTTREERVGITSFVNPESKGFSGVLKTR